jgi:hypothetical protein
MICFPAKAITVMAIFLSQTIVLAWLFRRHLDQWFYL